MKIFQTLFFAVVSTLVFGQSTPKYSLSIGMLSSEPTLFEPKLEFELPANYYIQEFKGAFQVELSRNFTDSENGWSFILGPSFFYNQNNRRIDTTGWIFPDGPNDPSIPVFPDAYQVSEFFLGVHFGGQKQISLNRRSTWRINISLQQRILYALSENAKLFSTTGWGETYSEKINKEAPLLLQTQFNIGVMMVADKRSLSSWEIYFPVALSLRTYENSQPSLSIGFAGVRYHWGYTNHRY